MKFTLNPFASLHPRVRQILLGWVITHLLVLWMAGYFLFATEWLNDWVSGFLFYGALGVVAGVAGRAYQRSRRKPDSSDGGFEMPDKPSQAKQSGKSQTLASSMIVPVLGYSLPFAVIPGIGSIFTGGSVTEVVLTALIMFVVTLPVAAFAGLTIFERNRPGEFGPESFEMPVSSDSNT